MPCYKFSHETNAFTKTNIASLDNPSNSQNGIMTKIWGPAGWLFLHCVSFGYPTDPDNFDIKNQNPPNFTRNNYLNF